jgi:hypothetical protein
LVSRDLRVLDREGSVLNAEFDVRAQGSGADVVLPGRYGGRGSQRKSNVDYFPALTLLFARPSATAPEIEGVPVDSRIALRLPATERLLKLDYRVGLTPATDTNGLRLALTRTLRTVPRDSAAGPMGANNHKRLRISVRAEDSDIGAADLALLQRPTRAVLAVEKPPSSVWQQLCKSLGVALSRPSAWPGRHEVVCRPDATTGWRRLRTL